MLSKLLTRFRKAEGPPPVIALELRNESIRYASLKPSVDTSGAPYLLHASGLVERSAFPDDTSWREEASRQIKKYTLKKSVPLLLLASNDYRVFHIRDTEVVQADHVRAAFHGWVVERPDDYVADLLSQLDDSVIGAVIKKSTLQARMAQANALGLKVSRVDFAETALAYLAYAFSEVDTDDVHPNRGVLSRSGDDMLLVVENKSTVIRTHQVPATDLSRVAQESAHIALDTACVVLYVDVGADTLAVVEALQEHGVAAEPLHPYGILAEEVAELFDEQQLQRLAGAAGLSLEDSAGFDWTAQYVPLLPTTVSEMDSLDSIVDSALEPLNLDSPPSQPTAPLGEPTQEITFDNLDELESPPLGSTPAPASQEPPLDLDAPLSFPPIEDHSIKIEEPVFTSSILQEEPQPSPEIVAESVATKPSLRWVGGVVLGGLVASVLAANVLWSMQEDNAQAHATARATHEAAMVVKRKALADAKKEASQPTSVHYSTWMASLAGTAPPGLWLTRINDSSDISTIQGMTKDKALVDTFVATLNTKPLAGTSGFQAVSVEFDTHYNLWSFRIEGKKP